MEKINNRDWYIWKNNNQICQAEEDQLDILNKHLEHGDIKKLTIKTEDMKIIDKLTKLERLTIVIIVSIFLCLASIISVANEYIVIEDIISWKMALILLPFILFAVSVIIYDSIYHKNE